MGGIKKDGGGSAAVAAGDSSAGGPAGFKTDSDKTDASGIPAVHAIIKELEPGTYTMGELLLFYSPDTI